MMSSQTKPFRRILLWALMAGVVSAQMTPLLAQTSLARRMCIHSLQVCDGCPVGVPEVDPCCQPGGGCAEEQAGSAGEPMESEPADQSSDADCTCCIQITLTTPWLSIEPDPHLLFSVLCIEDALFTHACHAQDWLDSLLRPPSI